MKITLQDSNKLQKIRKNEQKFGKSLGALYIYSIRELLCTIIYAVGHKKNGFFHSFQNKHKTGMQLQKWSLDLYQSGTFNYPIPFSNL